MARPFGEVRLSLIHAVPAIAGVYPGGGLLSRYNGILSRDD